MNLLNSRKRKKITFGAVALMALGSIAYSASMTGSYFSDTQDGNISGTVGSIKVSLESSTLAFNNLLPGDVQTVRDTYTNTGSSPQDVYLVFPNATALSALNDLGTYGEVHVTSNGTEVFASKNLNDHASCPPGSTSTAYPFPCNALPGKVLLASHVAPHHSGNFSFGFGYASKLTGSGGGVWNTYPDGDGQTTVKASDGSGSGLPFQVVAVQVGQQP
jgi:hypothetical protein